MSDKQVGIVFQCDREDAEWMFNIFSESMNSLKGNYCRNFEYLSSDLRQSWIVLAKHIRENNGRVN